MFQYNTIHVCYETCSNHIFPVLLDFACDLFWAACMPIKHDLFKHNSNLLRN